MSSSSQESCKQCFIFYQDEVEFAYSPASSTKGESGEKKKEKEKEKKGRGGGGGRPRNMQAL